MIKRLISIIAGVFNKRVRQLEWQNAEGVYSSALKERRQAYQAAAEATGGAKAQLSTLQSRLEQKLKELEQAEGALEQFKRRHDEVNGPRALIKVKSLREETVKLERLIRQLHPKIEGYKNNLRKLKVETERLESEKAESIAEIKSLQAMRKVQSIDDKFFSGSQDMAVSELRERLAQEASTAEIHREIQGHGNFDYAAAQNEFSDMCVSEAEKVNSRSCIQLPLNSGCVINLSERV